MKSTTSHPRYPYERRKGWISRWLWSLIVLAVVFLLGGTFILSKNNISIVTPTPTEDLAISDPFANLDPSGQTVIFWHQYTGDRKKVLIEIAEEFNRTNDLGITVKSEYQDNYNDIFNKVLTVLNTPDAPQLVMAYQSQAANYQLLANALVDVNPYVDSIKWGLSQANKEDFFPGFSNQDLFPNFSNARLGFPLDRSMEVLYYNLDWLKELGYEAPPKTPDEFKEMACKAARTPFSKATAEGSIGYELSVDASRFASWTFAFGGDVFDYEKGEYSFNNDAAFAAWMFIQGLFKNKCATLVMEKYGDQTDFSAGKLLFSVGSSSSLPFYKKAVDEDAKFIWNVAPIPYTGEYPAMNIYGASVSMPKSTPEGQLAAWLFLKYYTSPEVQVKWVKASNYFPVRAGVEEGLADYFAQNTAYKTVFDMLKFSKSEPPTPGYDFIRETVKEAMAAIVDGAEVKPTLDKLSTNANANLAELLKQMKK